MTYGWLLAACAVLPLATPLLWGGGRLSAHIDAVLAVVDPPLEAPLSVRSPLGVWALLVTLVWFGLAYRARRVTWWEFPLVAIGGAVALVRVGNVWLDGLLLIAPVARQVNASHVSPSRALAVSGGCVMVALALAISGRPLPLPLTALDTALHSSAHGRIFADARWAPELQRHSPTVGIVLGGLGLAAESDAYWLDYLRVGHGHARWDTILRNYDARVVVLDGQDRQRAAAELVRVAANWRVLVDDGGVLVAERTQ